MMNKEIEAQIALGTFNNADSRTRWNWFKSQDFKLARVVPEFTTTELLALGSKRIYKLLQRIDAEIHKIYEKFKYIKTSPKCDDLYLRYDIHGEGKSGICFQGYYPGWLHEEYEFFENIYKQIGLDYVILSYLISNCQKVGVKGGDGHFKHIFICD